MASFCDVGTPCGALTQALGSFVYFQGPPETKDRTWYSYMARKDGHTDLVRINYCPFCGTRMMFTDDEVLEKWRLPVRRVKKLKQQLFLPAFMTPGVLEMLQAGAGQMLEA
jgi:hypothetical protein